MSDTPQYGENGFIPTVKSTKWEGETLLMETIDSRQETDLIGKPGEPLKRAGEYLTEEQKEKLAIQEN